MFELFYNDSAFCFTLNLKPLPLATVFSVFEYEINTRVCFYI